MYPTVTDRKIKIAIVGCGRISKNLFGSIEKHQENLELVSICDNDAEVLTQHEEQYGVTGYLRMEEMLEQKEIDLIALCTPSGVHSDQAAVAARFGVHVMTEKPMATRWQDGVRMVKACDDAGVRLFVVKQNRRNTTLQLLKRAVDEGRFGKIHMVHLNVFWTRPQAYYDQAKWRGTWEFDGGAFMNQASHYVDLLDWLIGPIDKVQAMMSTARDIEVEDTALAIVKFKSGALGSLIVSNSQKPGIYGKVHIHGDNGASVGAQTEGGAMFIAGMAPITEPPLNDLWTIPGEEILLKKFTLEDEELFNKVDPMVHFIRLQIEEYLDALENDREPLVNGEEGRETVELFTAIYRSTRDNKPVKFPLSPETDRDDFDGRR